MEEGRRMEFLEGDDGASVNVTIKTNVPEQLEDQFSQCELINTKEKKFRLLKHPEKKNVKAHNNKIVPVSERVCSTKRNKSSKLSADVDDVNENTRTETSVPEKLEAHVSKAQIKTKDRHREFDIDGGLGNFKLKTKEDRVVSSMSTRSMKSRSTQNKNSFENILPIQVDSHEPDIRTSRVLKGKVRGVSVQGQGEKSYTCKLCEKSFARKEHLNKHTLVHTREKRYICDFCKKRFSQSSNLYTHIRTHTKEKSYTCKLCEKSFACKQHLNIHILVHTREKKYMCEFCQKRFTQSSNLYTHIRTHTREKPYACNLCTKTFSVQSNLNTHILLHSGEKNHICKFCQTQFARRYTLDKHFRTHTKEKPYPCNLCTKTFSVQFSLNRHILVHSGEKKHICQFCQRQFARLNTLDEHIRTHTREKPYGCDKCPKTFSQSSSLKYHKTHRHNI